MFDGSYEEAGELKRKCVDHMPLQHKSLNIVNTTTRIGAAMRTTRARTYSPEAMCIHSRLKSTFANLVLLCRIEKLRTRLWEVENGVKYDPKVHGKAHPEYKPVHDDEAERREGRKGWSWGFRAFLTVLFFVAWFFFWAW